MVIWNWTNRGLSYWDTRPSTDFEEATASPAVAEFVAEIGPIGARAVEEEATLTGTIGAAAPVTVLSCKR